MGEFYVHSPTIEGKPIWQKQKITGPSKTILLEIEEGTSKHGHNSLLIKCLGWLGNA